MAGLHADGGELRAIFSMGLLPHARSARQPPELRSLGGPPINTMADAYPTPSGVSPAT
jgi:hypothetical protein